MKVTKEQFTIARGISIIANLAFAMWASALSLLVVWLGWYPGTDTMLSYLFYGFTALYILCAIYNLYAVQGIKKLPKGDENIDRFKNQALKQAWWIPLPLLLPVTLNRIRGELWSKYLEQETGHIEDEADFFKANIILIDQMNNDGYINNKTHDEQKAKYEQNLKDYLEKKHNINQKGKKKQSGKKPIREVPILVDSEKKGDK